MPIHPEDPCLVNGVKLVNGDWDCKDFLWKWACTESPLVLTVAGKSRSLATLDGPLCRIRPPGSLKTWAFHRPARDGSVQGCAASGEEGCGLSPRRKSVNAAPPTAIDTGTARAHLEAVAPSSRSSRFEL